MSILISPSNEDAFSSFGSSSFPVSGLSASSSVAVSYTHLDVYKRQMLRIAVQAKCRLYDETMSFLGESDIKLSAMKRSLLVQSSNFPLEVLFLRDDDIPQSVATGVADIGIVGENEFVEKNEDAEIIKRLGCLLYTSPSGTMRSAYRLQGSMNCWCMGFSMRV